MLVRVFVFFVQRTELFLAQSSHIALCAYVRAVEYQRKCQNQVTDVHTPIFIAQLVAKDHKANSEYK